jgi:hypothetical protein
MYSTVSLPPGNTAPADLPLSATVNPLGQSGRPGGLTVHYWHASAVWTKISMPDASASPTLVGPKGVYAHQAGEAKLFHVRYCSNSCTMLSTTLETHHCVVMTWVLTYAPAYLDCCARWIFTLRNCRSERKTGLYLNSPWRGVNGFLSLRTVINTPNLYQSPKTSDETLHHGSKILGSGFEQCKQATPVYGVSWREGSYSASRTSFGHYLNHYSTPFRGRILTTYFRRL